MDSEQRDTILQIFGLVNGGKMSNKVRKFDDQFKLKAVLESYASGNVSATATAYDIHISVLNRWRKELQENANKVFAGKRKAKRDPKDKRIEELEKALGRSTLQVEILKKGIQLLD